MSKRYIRTIRFLPDSTNFCDLEQPDGRQFDIGDEGAHEDQMNSVIRADSYLLSLLKGMNDRQKVILMYQIMRESGYSLNHADCATTLAVSRERYMVLLKEVKKRSAKILQWPTE